MKERSNINRDRFEDFDQTQASSTSAGRSFSRILQEILNHLTEIVRSEVRLARTEVRQDVTRFARAGVFVVIGAVGVLYAVGFLLLGAVYALATQVAPWLAAVIVGIAVAIVAAVFLQIGRARVKQASLRPDETIQSLQENITWMKKQTR